MDGADLGAADRHMRRVRKPKQPISGVNPENPIALD